MDWKTTPAGVIVPASLKKGIQPVQRTECPQHIKDKLKVLRAEFAARAGRR
jgi:hypothetical protein